MVFNQNFFYHGNEFLFVAIAALVPLVIGFIWYGPLFGNAWMNEMGFTKESMEGQNHDSDIYFVSMFLVLY